jgi:heat shock protein HtpX
VMELCVDNPREGFADQFATHPSVESRVQALVEYAGGHDPGPLALPSDATREPSDQPQPHSSTGEIPSSLPKGPWSDPTNPTGASPSPSPRPWGNPAGPWGRH